ELPVQQPTMKKEADTLVLSRSQQAVRAAVDTLDKSSREIPAVKRPITQSLNPQDAPNINEAIDAVKVAREINLGNITGELADSDLISERRSNNTQAPEISSQLTTGIVESAQSKEAQNAILMQKMTAQEWKFKNIFQKTVFRFKYEE